MGDLGVNYTPYAPLPTQQKITDDSGNLLSQYQLNAQPDLQFHDIMGDVNSKLADIPELNTQGLEALRSYGTGTGDSPWAQAQLQAQQLGEATAQGGAGAQAQGAQTNAMDTLAAHGGLSTGAAERLATSGQNNLLAQKQNVAGQGQQARLGIRAQDEQNRLGVLENLPGQEAQALQPALQEQSLWQSAAEQNQAQQQALESNNRQYQTGVDQYNLGNSIGQVNANNSWNQNQWQTQMQEQGAMQAAQAEENRGKK